MSTLYCVVVYFTIVISCLFGALDCNVGKEVVVKGFRLSNVELPALRTRLCEVFTSSVL